MRCKLAKLNLNNSCEYMEYFNGVSTIGHASHMSFLYAYIQPKIKFGDASALNFLLEKTPFHKGCKQYLTEFSPQKVYSCAFNLSDSSQYIVYTEIFRQDLVIMRAVHVYEGHLCKVPCLLVHAK